MGSVTELPARSTTIADIHGSLTRHCYDDRGSDTDDDCDGGPEETRTFLYRHFTITIVANETPRKLDLVFMKATVLQTKGEDNNPRT